MTARNPESKLRRGTPRRVVLLLSLLVWLIGVPLVHGVVPWAISLLSHRYGWIDGVPGRWNLVGLLPIAAGSAWLIWIMAAGLSAVPETVDLELPTRHLLLRGPYSLTRNPMYAGELGLWVGWAVWYGSAAVCAGFVIFYMAVQLVVLPREEHALEARFGHSYRAYKAVTPRWFGKP